MVGGVGGVVSGMDGWVGGGWWVVAWVVVWGLGGLVVAWVGWLHAARRNEAKARPGKKVGLKF